LQVVVGLGVAFLVGQGGGQHLRPEIRRGDLAHHPLPQFPETAGKLSAASSVCTWASARDWSIRYPSKNSPAASKMHSEMPRIGTTRVTHSRRVRRLRKRVSSFFIMPPVSGKREEARPPGGGGEGR